MKPRLIDLKKRNDTRGSVFKMMRRDSKYFKKFGEIYFSSIKRDKIKAWSFHKKMTCNLTCIVGSVEIVIYDERTKKTFKFLLSRKKYKLLTIPPKLWYGFKNLSKKESIIANFASLPHFKNEVLKKQINDESIPFKWK